LNDSSSDSCGWLRASASSSGPTFSRPSIAGMLSRTRPEAVLRATSAIASAASSSASARRQRS